MGSFRSTASGSAFLAAAFVFTASTQLAAQDADFPPAHLAIVDGTAMLARDSDLDSATTGVPIVPGDRVQTTTGRLEIVFPDGSALDVDEYSSVEIQALTLLRITSGRALLTVFGVGNRTQNVPYLIDTPFASVEASEPGEYRISVLGDPVNGDGETELAVRRGFARFTTERGVMAVGAGQLSVARNDEAPAYAQAFNSARFDEFDRWTTTQRDERLGRAASAQYLPSNLRMYGGAFDRYGTWEYDSQYGEVWYPTSASEWRPYSNGYWSSVPSYGWTWVGSEAWAWPTHHYGRWGFAHSRWFWIPERQWAPAWVSWAAAPGYVSWCPLGFDNRPVFSLSVGVGHSWDGWVVLPRPYFGARDAFVARYAIDARRLPRSTPFVVQSSAPFAAPRAALRNPATSGIRAGGRFPLRQPNAAALPTLPGRTPRTLPEVTRPIPVERSRAIPRSGGAPLPGFSQPEQGQPPNVFSRNPGAVPAIVTPSPAAPGVFATQPGISGSVDQSRSPSRRWPGSRQAVTPPPLVAPPPPPPASAPGAVPRWSAPSVGVPTWAAPSVSVPRASVPSLSGSPAPAPRPERMAVPRFPVPAAAPAGSAPAEPAAAPASPPPPGSPRHDPASRHPR